MADREKVLTQLAGIGIALDMAGYHDDAQCVRNALAMLREPARGWISVKERMPEPNVSVLLAVYDRDHGYTYRTVAWLNTSGDWDSNDDGFNQGDEDVLYWMPLPKPPEEVQG